MIWNPTSNPVHKAIAIGDAAALARHYFKCLTYGLDGNSRADAIHEKTLVRERSAAFHALFEDIRSASMPIFLTYCLPVFQAAFPGKSTDYWPMLEALRASLSWHFRTIPAMRDNYEHHAQAVYQCLLPLVHVQLPVPRFCHPSHLPKGWVCLQTEFENDENIVKNYATTRRGLLLSDGCDSFEIHKRGMVLENLYPLCLHAGVTQSEWSFPYSTDDLIRIAQEGHAPLSLPNNGAKKANKKPGNPGISPELAKIYQRILQEKEATGLGSTRLCKHLNNTSNIASDVCKLVPKRTFDKCFVEAAMKQRAFVEKQSSEECETNRSE